MFFTILSIITLTCASLSAFVFDAHITTSEDCLFEQNECDRDSGKTQEIEVDGKTITVEPA